MEIHGYYLQAMFGNCKALMSGENGSASAAAVEEESGLLIIYFTVGTIIRSVF